MTPPSNKLTLRVSDHLVNTFQAGLLAIPGIGASLEKLLFGSIQELRMKRVEYTLMEVGKRLEEINARVFIDNNEDLANLVERVVPPLSKAINEDERVAYRTILVNASQIPPRAAPWDEVSLMSNLLTNMNSLDLNVLQEVFNLHKRCRVGQGYDDLFFSIEAEPDKSFEICLYKRGTNGKKDSRELEEIDNDFVFVCAPLRSDIEQHHIFLAVKRLAENHMLYINRSDTLAIGSKVSRTQRGCLRVALYDFNLTFVGERFSDWVFSENNFTG